MASDEHYQAVLADLRAKRAKLDETIAALEQEQRTHQGGASEAGSPSGAAAEPTLTPGSFLRLSLSQAIRAYLTMVDRKQSTAEIAAALQQGGYESRSKDFPALVHTVLKRKARQGKEIVKLKSGWGLADWSPHLRRKPGKGSKGHPGMEESADQRELVSTLKPKRPKVKLKVVTPASSPSAS